MNIAGYLTHTSLDTFSGEPGSHYDYIMARNGLFVRAETRGFPRPVTEAS